MSNTPRLMPPCQNHVHVCGLIPCVFNIAGNLWHNIHTEDISMTLHYTKHQAQHTHRGYIDDITQHKTPGTTYTPRIYRWHYTTKHQAQHTHRGYIDDITQHKTPGSTYTPMIYRWHYTTQNTMHNIHTEDISMTLHNTKHQAQHTYRGYIDGITQHKTPGTTYTPRIYRWHYTTQNRYKVLNEFDVEDLSIDVLLHMLGILL